MIGQRHTIKLFWEEGLNLNHIAKRLSYDKLSRDRVFYCVKRLQEACSIYHENRSGRPRTDRTRAMIKGTKARFRRNPLRSVRRMTPKIRISRRSLQRLVKQDKGVLAYKKRNFHGFT